MRPPWRFPHARAANGACRAELLDRPHTRRARRHCPQASELRAERKISRRRAHSNYCRKPRNGRIYGAARRHRRRGAGGSAASRSWFPPWAVTAALRLKDRPKFFAVLESQNEPSERRVRSSLETVSLGKAENGAIAHMDRHAFEADGIIVLGRVKTHPESADELASGLLKMCTIGLGKQAGAQEAHTHKLWDSVRAVPRLQLQKSKVLFGVAVVENAFRKPVEIEVVPAGYEPFLEADMRLLKIAKPHLGTIPFDRLDLLIVDEIGKNITGSGMDLNVIGRWRAGNGPTIPDFRRISVLSLTAPSLGNGLGIGLADFTTERFVRAYDPFVSYVNLLTATEPGGNTREGPLPLALPSDREAIEVGLFSAVPAGSPRVCRIKNTNTLEEIQVSEALLEDVKQNPKLTVLERPAPLPYDGGGNLL